MNQEILIQLSTILTVLGLAFALWAGVIAYRLYQARKQVGPVFSALRERGELAGHVPEETFRRAYLAAESPRGGVYTLACALLCTVAIPPMMAVFSEVWHEIWLLTGRFQPAARGTLVYTFSLFLMSMGVMIAVLWFGLRRYHMRRPKDLRRAIRDLNEGLEP